MHVDFAQCAAWEYDTLCGLDAGLRTLNGALVDTEQCRRRVGFVRALGMQERRATIRCALLSCVESDESCCVGRSATWWWPRAAPGTGLHLRLPPLLASAGSGPLAARFARNSLHRHRATGPFPKPSNPTSPQVSFGLGREGWGWQIEVLSSLLEPWFRVFASILVIASHVRQKQSICHCFFF